MAQNYGQWVPAYYDAYKRDMGLAGLTPVDKNTWAKQYYGIDNAFYKLEDGSIGAFDPLAWDRANPNFEGGANRWRGEVRDNLIGQYNTSADELHRVSGSAYIPYDGSMDIEDIARAVRNMKSSVSVATNDAYDQYVSDTTEAGGTPVERDKWTPETKVEEKPKYEFVMPEEWQTVEDLANETVNKGEPTLDPNLVTSWENKLETSYAPVRNKLKQNMANYWASLFPQGGGSGRQAEANMEQLTGFETNKFERALDFANSDLANKLAAFQLAQKQLSDIGAFKAQADQFKSSLDASNYWNQISSNWNTTKYFNDIMQADKSWQRNSDLAKYLADITRPQQSDFGTQVVQGLTNPQSIAALIRLISGK